MDIFEVCNNYLLRHLVCTFTNLRKSMPNVLNSGIGCLILFLKNILPDGFGFNNQVNSKNPNNITVNIEYRNGQVV